MSNKIPFVISESHPDYKRPYCNQYFGTCDESDIPFYFINEVSEFIFERSDSEEINNIEGIQNFWDQYYSDYYMDNQPWSAKIFINNEWIDVTPTYEEMLEGVKKLILKNINNETSYDLSEDEEIIIEKMREYFIKQDLILENFSLDEKETFEEFINVLNKHLLNNNIQNFNENKELIINFIKILIKYIKQDIEHISNKNITIENDETLNRLINIYNNLLEYNSYFYN